MRHFPTLSRRKAWMIVPLMFAPVLGGGCSGDPDPGPQVGGVDSSASLNSPVCSDYNRVLSTTAWEGLVCKLLPLGLGHLPDCKKYSEALTSDGKQFLCSRRNDESASTRTALDNLERSERLLQEYATRLSKLGPTRRTAKAVFCGVTANTTPGAIVGNGATGIAAATYLCRQVASCNKDSAKMCTASDMYYSAATEKLLSALPQSWVFMASWMHNNPAQLPTASGLADNCSGYTYGMDDKLWYGTTVEWKETLNGHRALHFASGPGVVSCSGRFPIACCN